MPYLIGKTATQHVDLLDKLKLFATGRSATAAAVNAGGTGYTVGDVLTATGGTFTIAVELVVTAVSGGVITAVRISQSGVYTSIPTNPVSVTGGTGTGATFDLTFNTSNGWVIRRRTKKAVSATVSAGGTGYTNNDVLTVPVTTAGGVASTWTATVSAGAVTSVALLTAGNYHETPTNPAATTGGTGTGCTLTITYADGTDENSQELILEGEGSGADDVFIGIRTYVSGTARNWELAGFTGYSANDPWSSQPGISPGRFDGTGQGAQGAFVPLNNGTITYFLFINGRRIIGVFKVSTTYTNMYLGFTNPFGTAAEFPYPLYVGGCTSLPGRPFGSTGIGYSGMTDPITSDTHVQGPHFIRAPDGTWKPVMNSAEATTTRNARDDLVVWPAGQIGRLNLSIADEGGDGDVETTDVIPNTGVPGTQSIRILQTPGTSVNLGVLIPTMIVEEGNQINIPRMVHGELDNVAWATSNLDQDATFATSEDVFVIGSDRYQFFQNCNRTDQWAFFCVKEE